MMRSRRESGMAVREVKLAVFAPLHTLLLNMYKVRIADMPMLSGMRRETKG
jgi:hypothetical protein